MDRPRDPNAAGYDPGADRPSDVPVSASDTQTPDMFGDSQNQGYDGQSQTLGGQSLGGMTQTQSDALDSSVGIQGAVSPDTTIAGAQSEGPIRNEAQDNAAAVITGASGDVVEPPANTEGTNSDPEEPNAVDAETFEGKKVFSPHELNQSGEDKEYFPPDKDHKYEVPKDANDHALTPDIEVKPDQSVGKVD